MKTLKCTIIFLFINFILIQPFLVAEKPAKKVNANETVWARITNDQTALYSDMACTMIKFYIPKSYFVKVLQIGDDSTRVIYMDDDSTIPSREGYLKTCDLLLYEDRVYNPYPNFSVKIIADEILFADSNKNYPKTVLSYGDTALIYGILQIQSENFCYVYSNGYIGYVRRSAFSPFEIPLHEIPLIKQDSSDQSTTNSSIKEPTQNSNTSIDSTMKIVIIVALSITCLSVVYLLFKPKAQTNVKLAISQDNDDDF